MASVDYFLKIDGVEGESLDPTHKGEIDVQSWHWAETRSGRPASAFSGSAHAVSMNDLVVKCTANKAVPQLSLAVPSGQRFPKAILTCRKAGKGQQDYMIWTFAEVVVQSFSIGGDPSSVIPTVTISLSFTEYNVQYRSQREDGSLDNAKKAGWNLKKNEKV